MKIKHSTFFLVLAALLLGGVVLIVQQQPAPKSLDSSDSSDPPTASTSQVASDQEKPILQFQEGDVQTLSLQTRLRSLKFERDKNGKWQMLKPDKTTASEPSIAFLLNQIAGKTQRVITVAASDREQFGFQQPTATIELTLKNKERHKLVLGEYNFNRSRLYAQVDPPADPAAQLNVLLVSPNFDNAVNRPLAEWKQPTTAEKPSEKSSEKSSEKTPSPSAATSASPPASAAPSPKDANAEGEPKSSPTP